MSQSSWPDPLDFGGSLARVDNSLKAKKNGRPAAASMLKLPGNLDTPLKATWWGQKPGGNWYWRCTVPARQLPGQVLALRYDDLGAYNGQVVMPRQRGEIAIWSYAGNAARGILMASMREAGFRVLLEVDDNYLIAPPRVPHMASSWQRNLDTSGETDKHSQAAHARIAAFVDGVVVTTETLADAYRDVTENVYVCRNSVDLDDWEEPEKPNDGVFRIGYAASHSHWFDLEDAKRALSWAADQPGVEVLMYGLDTHALWPHTQIPWETDLAAYRKSLQLLDVGLCPLRSNPWSDCKSDIKLMEYTMAGAATIIADAPPYSGWNEMTPVAQTPKDFLKHVKWFVKNQDAAKEYVANCKAEIVAHRTIQSEVGRWEVACGL